MPRPDLETNVWEEVVTLTATEWVRSQLGRSCVCVCVCVRMCGRRKEQTQEMTG